MYVLYACENRLNTVCSLHKILCNQVCKVCEYNHATA